MDNSYTTGIFARLRSKHEADLIVVDAKNTEKITPKDISRVADYLNDRIGRVAIIVSRKKESASERRHAHRQLIDNEKLMLFISDEDLKRWIHGAKKIKHETGEKIQTVDPEKSIQNKYNQAVSD